MVNLDHNRNARDKTSHPEEDIEAGKTVARGEGVEIEELDIATVDGPVVSGVASGSPIEGTQ